MGGLMLNNLDLGELAPKLIRSEQFGRNWDLTVAFLNLYTAFISTETCRLSYTGYLDMLVALKLLDLKDIKMKSRFSSLFKQFSDKRKPEASVANDRLADLLFQTYEAFVRIDEFNINDIIGNARSVVQRQFKDLSAVMGKNAGFVIETIISKEYFADHQAEIDFCTKRVLETVRLPMLETLSLNDIPLYYKEYSRVFKILRVVPAFIAERGLWQVLNGFLVNLIELRRSRSFSPHASNANFDSANEMLLPDAVSPSFLNLFHRTHLDAARISHQTMFKHIFEIVFSLINQWNRDKQVRPALFKDQFAVYCFKRVYEHFAKLQAEALKHEMRKRSLSPKSRMSGRRVSTVMNRWDLTGGEVTLINKYKQLPMVEFEDLIEKPPAKLTAVSGKDRIKMITELDLMRKRIELDFDKSDQVSYAAVLDGFVDSFFSQADTPPPEFEPRLAKSRLVGLVAQINQLNTTANLYVEPDELVASTLATLDAKRQKSRQLATLKSSKKEYLDLMEYLAVLIAYIHKTNNFMGQALSAAVFRSKLSTKNLFDTVQVVTYDQQNQGLNKLYFTVIDFLRSQHHRQYYLKLFDSVKLLFAKLSFNNEEVYYPVVMNLMREKNLLPRIFSFRVFYLIYSKQVTIYIKSKIEKIGSRIEALQETTFFTEIMTDGALMILDRHLFTQLLMCLAIYVPYPKEVSSLKDRMDVFFDYIIKSPSR